MFLSNYQRTVPHLSKVGLVGLGEVVESVVGGPVVTDIHPGDLGDTQLGYSLLSVHQSGVLGLFITIFWQSQTTKSGALCQ